MRDWMMGPVAGLWALVVSVIAMPLTANASGVDEGSHQHINVAIHYIEMKPNAEVEDVQNARIRELFKRVDPINTEQDGMQSSRADQLAVENGLLDIPHPLYDALIQELAQYHIKAYPTFFSALRSREQAEQLRKELAGKYHPRAEDADFVLSLQPYQATLNGEDESVVWIGVRLQNRRANTSNLYYVSVPFGKQHNRGFDREDGKRMAAVLVDWLAKQGLIRKN